METPSGCTDLLRGFELTLTVEGLRPSTVRHYVRDAKRLCVALSGDAITSQSVRVHLSEFGRGHGPKTVREAQIALRRFFRWLITEGELDEDPMQGLRLASFRVSPQPTYSDVEVRRLLGACSPATDLLDIRNRALILTLYDTGVREGELVSMQEVDWEAKSVRVAGKTGSRTIPLGTLTLQAIDRYVRRWGIIGPPLWRGERGPLTGWGILQIVRRLCGQAGIQHKGVHAFRRAAAAQMKRLGMQDSDIMRILGWKSVVMLNRYTAAVGEELAHKAHILYSPADHLQANLPPLGPP